MSRLPWYSWVAISTGVILAVVFLAWLVLDGILTCLGCGR